MSYAFQGTGFAFQRTGFAFQQNLDTPAPVYQTPAGSAGKRKHRYFVEIDGQTFFAEDQAHAQAILDHAADLAKQAATRQAEQIASRVQKARRIGLATPKIATNAPIDLAPYRQRLKQAYRDAAIEVELRLHMLREIQRQEDEEAAVILLLQ